MYMTPSKFFKFLKTTKLRRCCFANSRWRGSQKCQNLSAPSTLKAIFLISFNIAWVIHLSFRPVQTICLERPHRKNRKQNHRKSCIHAVFLIFSIVSSSVYSRFLLAKNHNLLTPWTSVWFCFVPAFEPIIFPRVSALNINTTYSSSCVLARLRGSAKEELQTVVCYRKKEKINDH